MMGIQKGLPGLRGGDHVGITVPDLEQATRFFVEVLGAERFYDLGPFASNDDWMTTNLGVDRTARAKIRFLRLGYGLNIELFEYTAPDQRSTPPRNSDIGGHHLALYVDDFATALDYLRAVGVQIMGQPTHRTSGPSAGQTWIYFLTPWGLQMELVSYPDGKAYENDSTSHLWNPRHPQR